MSEYFEFTETMDKLERNLRKKNREVNDENVGEYLDDFAADAATAEAIDRDVYDYLLACCLETVVR